jgi:hypothetical protein
MDISFFRILPARAFAADGLPFPAFGEVPLPLPDDPFAIA